MTTQTPNINSNDEYYLRMRTHCIYRPYITPSTKCQIFPVITSIPWPFHIQLCLAENNVMLTLHSSENGSQNKKENVNINPE